MKFHKNPSGGSRVVTCGQKDRQTNMKKLIIAFHNVAKAPKKSYFLSTSIQVLLYV
jgi:hypothetical protein